MIYGLMGQTAKTENSSSTLPRSERLKRNPTATAKDDLQGMERTLGPRCSSCLWLQLFRVEMYSFLPDD